MSKKNQLTTTTYLEWSKAMSLLMKLEKDKEYKMLLFCASGFFFGLRASDLLSISWDTILYKDEFELNEQKTKKHRKIRISADMQKIIIKAYKSIAPVSKSELIFINKYGAKAISIQYVNKKLKQIAKKYNLKNLTSSHTLRKTFGRKVYSIHENEHSLVLLSELFSHRCIATTKRYLGLREEQLLNVYDDLSMF